MQTVFPALIGSQKQQAEICLPLQATTLTLLVPLGTLGSKGHLISVLATVGANLMVPSHRPRHLTLMQITDIPTPVKERTTAVFLKKDF